MTINQLSIQDSKPNLINRSPFWQLVHWIADPLDFQDKYYQKYGDVFTMHLFGQDPAVIISNPQAIQEIFNKKDKFDVGRANKLAEPILGKNSLMLMDGKRHQRERKLLMPSFHGECLKRYAQQICQITEQVASQLPTGQTFIARTTMQKISLEVIIQIVFGLTKGERYQQLQPLLTEWLNLTASPLRSSMLFFRFLQQDWGKWSPWGSVKQRQQKIHNLLQAEIEERRAKGEQNGTDILSLMMATTDENGVPMSDAELRDELLSLLFAGHETTATSLAWAFYQIHQRADVREKLLQELDSVEKDADPISISKLPYLTAVCQETLRMYPVLPVIFPRIAKSPIEIAGYSFDAETTLMPSVYLVHYREDIYPEPYTFKPERFLEREYSSAEYFPFGGGSRRCVGYALAQLEMKLVLATILSKYQLALAEEKPPKIQRRGFTLAPAGGISMVMSGHR